MIRLNRMKGYLPTYYGDARIAMNIVDQEAEELDAIDSAVVDTMDQFFIDTATWGLTRWERICGITPDLSKPIEQRRSLIMTKFRGIGTVSIDLIKNIGGAFVNGEIDVTEYNKNQLPKLSDVGWTKPSGFTLLADYSFSIVGNGTARTAKYTVGTRPNTVYTVSAHMTQTGFVSPSSNGFIKVEILDGSGAVIGATSNLSSPGGDISATFTVPANGASLRFNATVNAAETAGVLQVDNFMIERGDTVTTFEPRKKYIIGITFVSNRGVPANVQDIQDALRSLIPAHLDIEFIFTYLQYGQLDSMAITWNDLEDADLTWDEFEKLDYRKPIVKTSLGLTMSDQKTT